MKKTHCLVLALTTLALTAVFGQQPPTPGPVQPPRSLTPPAAPAPSEFNTRLKEIVDRAAGTPSPAPSLTKFNLDFPGGTPKQLVAAIQNATGKPLNAIIAEEHTNVRIPPIKLSGVTVPELFSALLQGSYKYRYNQGGPREVSSSYGFETDAKPPSDDSIWRFFSYNAPQAASTGLTKFDLDFPGGAPKELVAAIKKATGKPLNAVIPDEYADTKLPPLKMDNVDISQLFEALQAASSKLMPRQYGFSGQPDYSPSFGFQTSGARADDSVWYFYVKSPQPSQPAKVCRFYSLSPYLERGLTVDDITTAIETGWRMLGDKETPAISFHKDTKLLIAVGDPSKLETIDAVLKALQPPKPAPVPAPAQSKPAGKSGGTPKADE